MNIQRIDITIHRRRGKPLTWALGNLTLGTQQFALIAGLAQGWIRSEEIRKKLEAASRRARRFHYQRRD